MRVRSLVALVILTAILTGCSVRNTNIYFSTGTGTNYAFTMGSHKCPIPEANLYFSSFSDYYETVIGENANNFDRLLVDSALALMTRVYTLNIYAEEKEYTLSSREESIVSSVAKDFYKSMSSEDRSKLGIDDKMVQEAAVRYAIAIKIYKSLMEGVDNVVTEDEARVMDAYVIYLSDKTNVAEVKARIDAGDDFAAICQMYSEGPKEAISFGKEEYPKEVDKVAFTLENDENSDMIETENGIYFIHCINKYNSEKSEINKLAIIDKRQKVLLDRIDLEQSENSYSEKNEDFFKEVSPTELKVSNSKKFFSDIEEALEY